MGGGFLRGVLATLAVGAMVAAIVGGLVIWSGVVDARATKRGGWSDRVLSYASTRSLRRHAEDLHNPRTGDAGAIAEGLQHYREMCLPCHGARGHSPSEFAGGLNPAAPNLSAPDIQAFSDGLLYEIIASGIRSTGMPGFAGTHSRSQIWALVAFVRHLPSLSQEESKALGR